MHVAGNGCSQKAHRGGVSVLSCAPLCHSDIQTIIREHMSCSRRLSTKVLSQTSTEHANREIWPINSPQTVLSEMQTEYTRKCPQTCPQRLMFPVSSRPLVPTKIPPSVQTQQIRQCSRQCTRKCAWSFFTCPIFTCSVSCTLRPSRPEAPKRLRKVFQERSCQRSPPPSCPKSESVPEPVWHNCCKAPCRSWVRCKCWGAISVCTVSRKKLSSCLHFLSVSLV